MNFFTSIVGVFALLVSFVLFGALIAVGIGSPGTFLLVVGGSLWALIAWAKRSKTFTERSLVVDYNPYLDRGEKPAPKKPSALD